QPLKQPRIDHDARAVRLDQILRARDRPRGAEKRNRDHPISSLPAFSYAKSPTCPPVCQKRTVPLTSPRRTRAIRPAMALAVYVGSRNNASDRAARSIASHDSFVGI